MRRSTRTWTVGIALTGLFAPARAGEVWIVDDDASPDADFHAIQDAIDAAFPGDVVLVLNGSYAPFVLDRELTILGYLKDEVSVVGTCRIVGVAGATIAELELDRLELANCAGAVVVQHLEVDELDVSNCADVRLLDVEVVPDVSGRRAARVIGSRVEFVDCLLRGTDGANSFPPLGQHGGDGLECTGASRVHLVRTTVRGGHGEDMPESPAGSGGDGGNGLRLLQSSRAILAGDGTSSVSGGQGGEGYIRYGEDGCGIDLLGTTTHVRHSGVTIDWICGNGVVEHAVPDDPIVRPPVDPAHGAFLRWEVLAQPGHHVLLTIGHEPAVVPDPASPIERLNVPLRKVDLGLVPPSGIVSYAPDLEELAGVLYGLRYVFQATVTAPSSEVRRTNSAPFVAPVWRDCNGNGVFDAQDIAQGSSIDCNADGLPDECEVDCNLNGQADMCDVGQGASEDCDGNGIPDECETDCDGNGVNDLCEQIDCNENGVLDGCDIVQGTSADCDANGVPDECETDFIERYVIDDEPLAGEFGRAVAMDGNVLLVSALESTFVDGIVYSYRRLGGGNGWTLQSTIDEPGVMHFGHSVDIDGARAVVGARGTIGLRAYAYRRIASGAWIFEAQLDAPGTVPSYDGGKVAISGDALILGAPTHDGGGCCDWGAAFVYRRAPGGWTLEATLIPSDAAHGQQFGIDVDLEGDVAVVGADRDDEHGFFAGAVYVFRHDGAGNWNEEAKLIPPSVGIYDQFGKVVAFDNGRLVAAAPDNSTVIGEGVFVYERIGASWTLTAEIPNPGLHASYGEALALRGDRLVVGSPTDDLPPDPTGSGFVHLYERQTDQSWLRIAELRRPGLSGIAEFGRSVTTDGVSTVIGVPRFTLNAGAAIWYVPGDCNANGIPDDCDLAAGTSADTNNNAVPDECET